MDDLTLLGAKATFLKTALSPQLVNSAFASAARRGISDQRVNQLLRKTMNWMTGELGQTRAFAAARRTGVDPGTAVRRGALERAAAMPAGAREHSGLVHLANKLEPVRVADALSGPGPGRTYGSAATGALRRAYGLEKLPRITYGDSQASGWAGRYHPQGEGPPAPSFVAPTPAAQPPPGATWGRFGPHATIAGGAAASFGTGYGLGHVLQGAAAPPQAAAAPPQAAAPAAGPGSVGAALKDRVLSRIPGYDAVTAVTNAPTWGDVPESAVRGGLTGAAAAPGALAGARLGRGLGGVAGHVIGSTGSALHDALLRRGIDSTRALGFGRTGGRVGGIAGALGLGLAGAALTQDTARNWLGKPSWEAPPKPEVTPVSLRQANRQAVGGAIKSMTGSWWGRMRRRYGGAA